MKKENEKTDEDQKLITIPVERVHVLTTEAVLLQKNHQTMQGLYIFETKHYSSVIVIKTMTKNKCHVLPQLKSFSTNFPPKYTEIINHFMSAIHELFLSTTEDNFLKIASYHYII